MGIKANSLNKGNAETDQKQGWERSVHNLAVKIRACLTERCVIGAKGLLQGKRLCHPPLYLLISLG